MIYFLGLGTNIGNLTENLKLALTKIGEIKNCSILCRSEFYTTEAWGNVQQADFLNAVVKVEAEYLPEVFLKVLQGIEKEMGRVREKKWGPRVIDIDILFCDDLVKSSTELTIPHPYAHKREFVLEPMCDIAEGYMHPVLKQTIGTLYVALKLCQEE